MRRRGKERKSTVRSSPCCNCMLISLLETALTTSRYYMYHNSSSIYSVDSIPSPCQRSKMPGSFACIQILGLHDLNIAALLVLLWCSRRMPFATIQLRHGPKHLGLLAVSFRRCCRCLFFFSSVLILILLMSTLHV